MCQVKKIVMHSPRTSTGCFNNRSSQNFIYKDFGLFIVVVLACYWALRTPRLQNCFLLGASLFFYGFGGPRFLLLILLCAATAYASALWIERRPERARAGLLLGSLVPLAILFVFKYFDFFVSSFDAALGAFGSLAQWVPGPAWERPAPAVPIRRDAR